jgi:hypothetical protein
LSPRDRPVATLDEKSSPALATRDPVPAGAALEVIATPPGAGAVRVGTRLELPPDGGGIRLGDELPPEPPGGGAITPEPPLDPPLEPPLEPDEPAEPEEPDEPDEPDEPAEPVLGIACASARAGVANARATPKVAIRQRGLAMVAAPEVCADL